LIENTTKGGEEKGLINLIRKDGRITAGGIPQGTPTGRYRHIGIVNIPRVGSVYGAELRSLFIPKAGWVMVGCDAVGIESRIEGHYCYPYPHGHEHAALLLDGDIHQKFADLIGSTRSVAKNVRYAAMYGCTPKKLTDILDCKMLKARKIHRDFWASNAALTQFKADITDAWEKRGGQNKGYLKGLDGRKLYGRSSHSLVNLVFQSAAAVVFKTASVMVNKMIEEEKLQAKQVLSFHDEYEFDVHPKDVERVLFLAAKAFEDAGKHWGLNVPIKGDAKFGESWEAVH
jgi:DNA polymerase I-like protein with 3'-5' exonuclease and polymerase domains